MSDNNLRLQVILNAVDKLTRPFRSAQASSKELAAAIQQSRARLKELDAQAGRIDGFRKASAQLAVTGNSLKAAREEAAKLATQFSATNRPTAAQARLLEQAKTALRSYRANITVYVSRCSASVLRSMKPDWTRKSSVVRSGNCGRMPTKPGRPWTGSRNPLKAWANSRRE